MRAAASMASSDRLMSCFGDDECSSSIFGDSDKVEEVLGMLVLVLADVIVEDC